MLFSPGARRSPRLLHCLGAPRRNGLVFAPRATAGAQELPACVRYGSVYPGEPRAVALGKPVGVLQEQRQKLNTSGKYFLPNPPELKGVLSLVEVSVMHHGKSFNFRVTKTGAQIPVVHESVVGMLVSDFTSPTACGLLCKRGPVAEVDRGLGLGHP